MMDFAVANRDSKNVSVLLSKGDGTFVAEHQRTAQTSRWAVSMYWLTHRRTLMPKL
jgi:hypothetical protein